MSGLARAAAPPPAARGAAALGRRLASDLHLADGSSPEGQQSLAFHHRRLSLGQLAMHHLSISRCRLTLVSEERLCLVLPLAGEATLWPQSAGRRRAFTADAGQTAVLVPPGPFLLRCECRSQLLLLPVPCRHLAGAAERLAGPAAARQLESRLAGWRQWRESDPRQREWLGLLQHSLRLLESSAGSRRTAPSLPGAALEAWILQTLALLVLLDPQDGRPRDPEAERGGRLERLIAHIEANLHRPLSLQELSERGGCSPRALQYAFQRRFGCGPMQWVRQRRLEAARQLLEGADPTESVRAIARRCGYINLSSFSRDIQNAFGRTPSALRPGGLWPEGQ
jgi:AraC-like DNA-binding protein